MFSSGRCDRNAADEADSGHRKPEGRRGQDDDDGQPRRFALRSAGHRVLVVDMDPQANATSGLGFPKGTLTEGIYEGLAPMDLTRRRGRCAS